jgi:2-polyprenyl-3-methyl-5-hydroxy-6-metoxy-1,4-benzoquinol methylase
MEFDNTTASGLVKHYKENRFHDTEWPEDAFYDCQIPRYKDMLNDMAGVTSYLDIGCNGGQGPLTFSKRTGNPSIGVDLNPRAIIKAKGIAMRYKIPARFFNANIFDRKTTLRFDVVSCFEFLEHWPDTERTLQMCERFLNPGGRVFISTPDPDVYDDGGNPEHVNMMTKDELLEALKDRAIIDFKEGELLIAQYKVTNA